MINLEQAEVYTFNIISGQLNTIQSEVDRIISARDSYIKLLENKYKAKFNQQTGQFVEKDKAK